MYSHGRAGRKMVASSRVAFTACVVIAAVVLATSSVVAGDGFYKKPNLFNFTHADEKLARQSIDRFGPVGMSIDLRLPPFQMYVGKIEAGSPAEATGKFKTGQKIESIKEFRLKPVR